MARAISKPPRTRKINGWAYGAAAASIFDTASQEREGQERNERGHREGHGLGYPPDGHQQPDTGRPPAGRGEPRRRPEDQARQEQHDPGGEADPGPEQRGFGWRGHGGGASLRYLVTSRD
jgi:hypothetical protein